MITGTLTALDGTSLRTLVWQADGARGRILLVHGLGEHAGRYERLAEALANRGYSVFVHDQRGHGLSGGRKGWVSSFDVFVEDLGSAVAGAMQSLTGPRGLFLYGHSMGALVLMRYLEARRPDTPGVVLSTPWLGTAHPIPRWKELAATVLRRVAPSFPIPTSIDPAELTADLELQEAYRRDNLIGHGISVGLYDAVLDAQKRAAQWSPPPGLPMLVLLPLADPVVNLQATEGWLQRAAHAEVARLPGARHEPHNDVGREDVYRRIADWLDARTPGARSG